MRPHMPRAILLVIGMSLLLIGGGEASATLSYFQAFKKAYPKAKAACLVCHMDVKGTKANLNAYGTALQALKAEKDAATMPDALLKELEAGDADADGASNSDEIAAGTGPGDPASTPPAQAAPATPEP